TPPLAPPLILSSLPPLPSISPSLLNFLSSSFCFFSSLYFSHIHSTSPSLHSTFYLSVAAPIKFKSLMLAYRVLAGSAPTYLNALVRANVTPRTLRSSSERRLALPSVQARQSRLFSFVVPRWWNELPSTTRAGASLSTF